MTAPATPPPIARDLTAAGRRSIARLAAGIDGRGHTDLVDRLLQRRDLRRELAGGLAVVVVLDGEAARW